MTYILDTNVISGLMKGSAPLIAQFRRISARDCAISAITEHELYYGAFRHPAPEKLLQRLDLLKFDVLPFDRGDARRASEIRSLLTGLGTPIGPFDALIAGQAMERDLTLVTHNTREFTRVPGLRVEDWEA